MTARTTAPTTAAVGPARNHQCGRRSRTTSSFSLSSFRGNGIVVSVRSAMPSAVHLAAEHRVVRGHPVEEQQAVEMVELVEDGAGLERVDGEDAVGSIGRDA